MIKKYELMQTITKRAIRITIYTEEFTMDFIKENTLAQEMGATVHAGMKRYWFPPETRRYVHVSRGAIMQNIKHKKNHPAILVVDDDGNRYAFHSVILKGPAILMFKHNHPDLDAHVFLVTDEGVEAYVDPNADMPIREVALHGNLPQEQTLVNSRLMYRAFKTIKRRIGYAIYGRPVSWCKGE